jgi:hypothetical protein
MPVQLVPASSNCWLPPPLACQSVPLLSLCVSGHSFSKPRVSLLSDPAGSSLLHKCPLPCPGKAHSEQPLWRKALHGAAAAPLSSMVFAAQSHLPPTQQYEQHRRCFYAVLLQSCHLCPISPASLHKIVWPLKSVLQINQEVIISQNYPVTKMPASMHRVHWIYPNQV